MERPDFLAKYVFDWEQFNVILSGKSALDSHSFLIPLKNKEQVDNFLVGYGFDSSNPVLRAEMFGYFQEAIQFVKRYFLEEGQPDGLPLKVPNTLYMTNDIEDLFLIASGSHPKVSFEDCLWAAVLLKIMHTLLHADKDLRSNYFSVIQQQIFDRYYKYILRDKDNNLYLGKDLNSETIALVDFQTKAKKSRDSIVIKMLHKVENVAEELFDRVGIRFITKTKVDALRVIKFLQEHYVIIAQNVKASRSFNSIVNFEEFKSKHRDVLKMGIRNQLSEERFIQALEREMTTTVPSIEAGPRNKYSSQHYRSMQFTCRQLISFRNPIVGQLSKLRKSAKESKENPLAEKILNIDMSLIARDIRFFYPYEVQVVDKDSHEHNTKGEASHGEYKKQQLIAARNRVFSDLIRYKKLNV